MSTITTPSRRTNAAPLSKGQEIIPQQVTHKEQTTSITIFQRSFNYNLARRQRLPGRS
jgi:hypothetical protein